MTVLCGVLEWTLWTLSWLNDQFAVCFLFTGSLLDSAPPDVPPRNPSMNRLNGRVATGIMGNPADRDGDFEPSYLVRTPSGNVYIPTGELAIKRTRLGFHLLRKSNTRHWRNRDNNLFLHRCQNPYHAGPTQCKYYSFSVVKSQRKRFSSRAVPQFRLWHLSSTSFPIHYSLVVLRLEVNIQKAE